MATRRQKPHSPFATFVIAITAGQTRLIDIGNAHATARCKEETAAMSMITTTHPDVGFESRTASVVSVAKRHWGFWSTLVWVVLALTVAGVSLIPLNFAYKWGHVIGITLDAQSLQSLGYLAFSVVAVVVIALAAARRSDWRVYLGLVWPRWSFIGLGFAVLVVEVTFNVGLFYLLPIPDDTGPGIVDDYHAALGNPVALTLFWLSLTVIAPVSEEIAFRGFILRGWMSTRLGVIGAIVLSSLLFAAIHGPDKLAVWISLFVGGMLLATMRWLSGSIVPSILMHATWNLGIGILMALGV
jgi:membrane protease YdiL (CAAX protease family)